MSMHSETILYKKIKNEYKQTWIVEQLDRAGYHVKASSLSLYIRGACMPRDKNIIKKICEIVEEDYGVVMEELESLMIK